MSRKALATIVLASLAVVACKRGGVALDLQFFELQGEVRAVSWTGGSGLTSGQWDFSREGEMIRGTWDVEKRDIRGRIKSARFSESDGVEEFNCSIEFTLDGNGAPVMAVNKNDFGTFEYVLVRNGLTGRLEELSLRDMADSVFYVYNYGDYACDSLGNWISRRFTVTCDGTVINSGAESRDIVYYDE